MRILFIGGHGHHFLTQAVRQGLAQAIGFAADGHDVEAAEKMARQRFGPDCPFIADYREAIGRLKPDAVSIGAVYAYNGDVLAGVLDEGMEKIVTDKPVVAEEAQWEQIEQRCRRRPEARIATEFNLRSAPAFRAAKIAVERGLIGEPILATAQKSYRFGERRPDFYKNREDYGGTLLWIASHGIDAVWYVTGRQLTVAAGHQGNLARRDYDSFEDHVAVCYTLANGGSAMVHADYLRPAAAPTHGDDRLRVAGSQGVVEVQEEKCTLITATEAPRDITDIGADAHLAQDLIDALNGKTTVYGTAQTLTMARWLLRSRQAADEGRWITL